MQDPTRLNNMIRLLTGLMILPGLEMDINDIRTYLSRGKSPGILAVLKHIKLFK
jgi:hypothetical protein